MTKRRVTKLFAVVALTSSAPALADHARVKDAPVKVEAHATHATPTPRPDPWATPPTPTPTHTEPLPPLMTSLFSLLGISVPRQLPNGAPACGNVASRAPRPVDCKPRH